MVRICVKVSVSHEYSSFKRTNSCDMLDDGPKSPPLSGRDFTRDSSKGVITEGSVGFKDGHG